MVSVSECVAKRWPARSSSRRQLAVVVDLAVLDDGRAAVLVRDRLVARVEVDDREPSRREPDAAVDERAFRVGAAMPERRRHRREAVAVDPAPGRDDPADPAHAPSLSPAPACSGQLPTGRLWTNCHAFVAKDILRRPAARGDDSGGWRVEGTSPPLGGAMERRIRKTRAPLSAAGPDGTSARRARSRHGRHWHGAARAPAGSAGSAVSAGALSGVGRSAPEHLLQDADAGDEQRPQIERDGPVGDPLEIVRQLLRHRRLVPAPHLRQPRQPRPDDQTLPVRRKVVRELGEEARPDRARADERHLPAAARPTAAGSRRAATP